MKIKAVSYSYQKQVKYFIVFTFFFVYIIYGNLLVGSNFKLLVPPVFKMDVKSYLRSLSESRTNHFGIVGYINELNCHRCNERCRRLSKSDVRGLLFGEINYGENHIL